MERDRVKLELCKRLTKRDFDNCLYTLYNNVYKAFIVHKDELIQYHGYEWFEARRRLLLNEGKKQ